MAMLQGHWVRVEFLTGRVVQGGTITLAPQAKEGHIEGLGVAHL